VSVVRTRSQSQEGSSQAPAKLAENESDAKEKEAWQHGQQQPSTVAPAWQRQAASAAQPAIHYTSTGTSVLVLGSLSTGTSTRTGTSVTIVLRS
jgi:hypothetical protein